MTPTQLTGAAIPVAISGKKYNATALRDRDFTELSNHIQDAMMDVVRRTASRCYDEQEKQDILRAGIKQASLSGWGTEEGFKWLNSREGSARLIFQMIYRQHPKILFDDFLDLFLKEDCIVENLEETRRVYLALNVNQDEPVDTEKEPADAESKS